MANMTPEELAELNKRSVTGEDPMSKISQMMGMPGGPRDDDEDDN
jgi:hypothetical protein